MNSPLLVCPVFSVREITFEVKYHSFHLIAIILCDFQRILRIAQLTLYFDFLHLCRDYHFRSSKKKHGQVNFQFDWSSSNLQISSQFLRWFIFESLTMKDHAYQYSTSRIQTNCDQNWKVVYCVAANFHKDAQMSFEKANQFQELLPYQALMPPFCCLLEPLPFQNLNFHRCIWE